MIYTTVAGEGGHQLCLGLSAVLGRMCGVIRLGNGELAAPESDAEILLWHSAGDVTVHGPRNILVFSGPGSCSECVEVPNDCVVIAGVDDQAAAGYAARRGLRLLDCGLSSKASLTFSSIGREAGVISLQRSITDIYGNSIDPMELPLSIQPKPHYPLLAAVGVLLLSGMGDRLL